MRVRSICLLLLVLAWGTAEAVSMQVGVELPQLRVAEYHRPYVAIWIAKPDHSVAANLAVWYQVDEQGKKWLKDLRHWWRRTGRRLDMPVDGVAGPTRYPGHHELTFGPDSRAVGDLEAGDYQLVVEAVRESGGHEVKRIDFHWPPQSADTLTAQGERELGAITLQLEP